MTELPLEQWFGLVRSQYASSQVSVRDFIWSSVKTSTCFAEKLKKATTEHIFAPVQPKEGDPPLPLSDSDYRAIAERAFRASIHLMSLVSGHSEAMLRKAFMTFATDPSLAAEAEDCFGWVLCFALYLFKKIYNLNLVLSYFVYGWIVSIKLEFGSLTFCG